MNSEVMQRHRPTCRAVGLGVLENYKVEFRKFASIVENTGSRVTGVVWMLFNEEDISRLDYQEYVHIRMYKRITVNVLVYGRNVTCFTYIMNPVMYISIPPPASYLQKIIIGGREFGVPENYLESLVNSARKMLR